MTGGTQLTRAPQSGSVAGKNVFAVEAIMRIEVAALSLIVAGVLLPVDIAQAQAVRAGARLESTLSAPTEFSAQSRRYRRAPARILVTPRYHPDDVYPRYYPGPNAVRECTAHLVQEYRPSGTVITPRMNCFWRPG